MAQQNDPFERRRRQLLTAPTNQNQELPEFQRARQKIKAQTGAKSREAQLQLQRQRAQAGGFGAGAGIKLGQQVQEQLRKEEAGQLADLAAQESAQIGARQLQREAQQLAGLEAEAGRQFGATEAEKSRGFQRELFSKEQDFKKQVFEADQQSKLALLDLEKQKFDFDRDITAFNQIMSTLELNRDNPVEAARLFESLAKEFTREGQSPGIQAIGEGLQLYVNTAKAERQKIAEEAAPVSAKFQAQLDALFTNPKVTLQERYNGLQSLIRNPQTPQSVIDQAQFHLRNINPENF